MSMAVTGSGMGWWSCRLDPRQRRPAATAPDGGGHGHRQIKAGRMRRTRKFAAAAQRQLGLGAGGRGENLGCWIAGCGCS